MPPFQKVITDQPERTVARGESRPPAPDTSTAEIIDTIGTIAGDAIKQVRTDEVEAELRQLGSEVLVAQRGGDLKNATERFKTLKAAQEQGQLTDGEINIQAEKTIKQVIAKSPGFAEDIRRQAATILGFDPTGSQIQGLFGKSGRNRPATPQTLVEKMMEKSEAISQATGIDAQDIFGMMGKAEVSELQKKIVSANAAVGQADAEDVFLSHQRGLDSGLNGFLGIIHNDIAQGNVNPSDKAALQAQLSQFKSQSFLELQKDLPAGTSATQVTAFRNNFNASFTAIERAIDNGTMEDMLTSQKNAYAAAASIQGFEALPGVAVLGSIPGGSELVSEYLRTMNNVKDPGQRRLLAAINPVFATAAAKQGGLANMVSQSFLRISGAKQLDGNIQPPAITDADRAMDDVVHTQVITTSTDEGVRNTVLERAKARGQLFKDFSMYAQPKARGLSSKEEVKYVKSNFKPKLDATVSSLSQEMAGRDDIVLSVGANGSISFTARPDASPLSGRFSFPRDVSGTFKDNLKRLEVLDKLVRNGWGVDVGEDNTFLERTLRSINSAVIIDDGLAPKPPTRRRFDPATGKFESIE